MKKFHFTILADGLRQSPAPSTYITLNDCAVTRHRAVCVLIRVNPKSTPLL